MWSVCTYIAGMNRAKTAEPIKMPFGMWAWVGLRNHILDGGLDPPMKRGNFGVGKEPSHGKV